jgi:CubicO group peptidase (beta-lactamase class C family)
MPIMAVTAYAAKGDEERIREAGAEGYVSKPISVVRFVEAVRALLAAPKPPPPPPPSPPSAGSAAEGAIAAAVRAGVPGAVGLVARAGETHVSVAGIRDLATGEPMTADTIFALASVSKPVTAAAAMMLVDDGVVMLDDPVDRWLPELAERRVVRSLDGPIEDTDPAERPITLRDLLSMRMGLGAVFADPSTSPLLTRIEELAVGPGPGLFAGDEEAFMRALGSLPLAAQPGARWLYHTGIDVAGVLIGRASGIGLAAFLEQRLFGPLGMEDTSFTVPEEKLGRLAPTYVRTDGGLEPHTGFDVSRPRAMAQGGAGLASTARDLAAFGQMLLGGGVFQGTRLISAESVAEMTRDQIPPEVKAASPFYPGFWDDYGWGLGLAVAKNGRFGWWGGSGTALFCDPQCATVAVYLSGRMMNAADDTQVADAFVDAAMEGRTQ